MCWGLWRRWSSRHRHAKRHISKPEMTCHRASYGYWAVNTLTVTARALLIRLYAGNCTDFWITWNSTQLRRSELSMWSEKHFYHWWVWLCKLCKSREITDWHRNEDSFLFPLCPFTCCSLLSATCCITGWFFSLTAILRQIKKGGDSHWFQLSALLKGFQFEAL